jgi:hypothetical protein
MKMTGMTNTEHSSAGDDGQLARAPSHTRGSVDLSLTFSLSLTQVKSVHARLVSDNNTAAAVALPARACQDVSPSKFNADAMG